MMAVVTDAEMTSPWTTTDVSNSRWNSIFRRIKAAADASRLLPSWMMTVGTEVVGPRFFSLARGAAPLIPPMASFDARALKVTVLTAFGTEIRGSSSTQVSA